MTQKNILSAFFIFISFFISETFAQGEKAAAGKILFESKCVVCHTLGKGKLIGPDLKDVTKRRKIVWIKKMIKDPESMLKSDATAKQLLKEHNNIPMINMNLKDSEVDAVIEYLKTQAQK